MKSFVLFILFSCLAPWAFSQDLLLMKNGKKIYCKIVRMDSERITMLRDDDTSRQESVVQRAEVSKIKYVGIKRQKSKPKKASVVDKPKNPVTNPDTISVAKAKTLPSDTNTGNTNTDKNLPPGKSFPAFMLGAATGMNSYSGLLGIVVKLNFFDRVALEGALGIGSWGKKFSVGIIYQKTAGSMYFGLGYSALPGVAGLKLNLELANKNMQEITVDFLQASTLNVKMGSNWKVGRKHLFYIEYGYAIPLQPHPWVIKNGYALSKTSIAELHLIQPGGLLFGLGFLFGLGK
jgi:hypothetical protein